MAPIKPRPLQKLRQQSAAYMRQRASALRGSAYERITLQNNAARYGASVRRDKEVEPEEDEEDQQLNAKAPAKKAVLRKKVTKINPRQRTKALANPPIVESWQPADGYPIAKRNDTPAANGETADEHKVSDTLAIARVASFRAEGFVTALRKFIETDLEMDIDDIMTSELESGGEKFTSVYVKCRSEFYAEAVKEKVDGKEVEGRKVQVGFA